MANRTGEQFDRYHLLRLLGEGNSGEVYLAEQVQTRQQVAIKILNTLYSQDFLEHFLREARTLFLLKHPRIVALLDFGLAGKTPFLAMAYAPNGTLYQMHQKGEQVPLATVNSYIQQAAEALQYAHEQRLIHRDIKPQNMLLGGQGQVLLGDFGVAAIAHSEQSLATQAAVGTVAYMAPEQIEGKPRPASDQYALGICVYEWLCGTRPFHGSTMEIVTQHLASSPDPLRKHAPTLPGAVEAVVLRALAKDPQQRYPDIAAFARAFAQALQAGDTAPWFAAATLVDTLPPRPAQTATLVVPSEEARPAPAAQHIPPLETEQETMPLSKQRAMHLQSAVPTLPTPAATSQPAAPPSAPLNPASWPAVTPPVSQLNASAQLVPPPKPATPVAKKRAPKLLLVVLALLLILAGSGGGYAYYLATRPDPSITVASPYQEKGQLAGAAATRFILRGKDFTASSAITFLLDGAIFPGAPAATSDSHGAFTATLDVTAAWPAGIHTLTARDASGYATRAGVKVEIVAPGQAGTPGPNGAPTDSASITINALVTTSSGSASWTLVVKNGTVCSPQLDNGQPQKQMGTLGGVAYTRTITRTCQGRYQSGVLDYTETALGDSYVFVNGVTCTARAPYISAYLHGTFADSTTVSGQYNTGDITYDCNPGAQSQSISANEGTWTGTPI